MFIYVNTGIIYSINLGFTLGLHRLLSGRLDAGSISRLTEYYLKLFGKHLWRAGDTRRLLGGWCLCKSVNVCVCEGKLRLPKAREWDTDTRPGIASHYNVMCRVNIRGKSATIRKEWRRVGSSIASRLLHLRAMWENVTNMSRKIMNVDYRDWWAN